jgi:Protein kinase domain
MVMVAPQNQHELAGKSVGLVHRVAQSPLGDLWLALDQRRGPPGEPVLLRYISLASGATRDTLDRVVAAAHTAMSLRNELVLPVLEVLQRGPLAVAYEYVEAQPLSTLQSSARARELLFPVGVSLRLIIDLLRALQAVHESWLGWPTEVPYGGLLPASVLVSREGRTHLCDALVASSALLQRGFDLSAAELAYRAPEQVYASTPPEPSTDVFIAGILLWELLSGRRLLSGSKEDIERKLLEHDLPRATADLRADGPLSRGLIELLDCSLSLDPNQRPPTPGGLATALERCGHVVGSRAEVAAFVNELAGPQLDRVATILRLALGYAAGADDAQLAAAVPSDLADEQPESAAAQSDLAAAQSDLAAAQPDLAAAPPRAAAAQWGAEAPRSSATAAQARERAVAPPAPPSAGRQAAVALPSGATSRSLAAAVALALERRRASGEFPAFAPETGRAVARATSLGSGAALPPLAPSAVLPGGTTLATSVRGSAPLPLRALSRVPSAPPLPWLRREGPADTSSASSAEEEKTTVQRAVRDHGGVRAYTTPSAPVRLAPKRALLAAMATVVLLIQLWMFALARSHKERSRPASPAESERVEAEPRSPEEATAEPLRASER